MSLWKDVQFSFRTMWKSPRITIAVLATLVLGIGANTAIFSMVNATLLKPLPFRDPGQLVELSADLRKLGARNVGFSVPELEDLRDRAGIFTAVSVVWPTTVNLTGGDHPDRLDVLAVSPNYFSILGANPQLGRLIDSRDTANGFAEAVVISDALWHKEFGGARSVIGRRVRLDNDLYAIVGVLPLQFHHPSTPGLHPVDMWLTAGYRADPFPAPQRSLRFLPGIIARLKPGITLQRAQAQLEVLSDSLRREYGSDYPATAGWTLSVTPLTKVVAGSARTLLTSLLLAVGLILLIACVNVANLLLVNATARQREMALRLALGATRGRIIRQMLTESVLLSLMFGSRRGGCRGHRLTSPGRSVTVAAAAAQPDWFGRPCAGILSRHCAADYLCLWAHPSMASFANASGQGGTAGTGRLCIAALGPTRQIFDWR
jgi:predicted permease